MTTALGIILIACVVSVDNALLTGLLLSAYPELHHRRRVLWLLGMLLGVSQIILAASVDQLLHNLLFRFIAIAVLGWMCVRTLTLPYVRSAGTAWFSMAKLWMFTVFGNLDNMIWLGAELKGDRLWLISCSIGTIPLFVVVAAYLSKQAEKQWWILPLGAGMMAWAAASLMLDIPVIKQWIANLDDAPRTTFQCLITVAILVIGFGLRRLLRRPLHL